MDSATYGQHDLWMAQTHPDPRLDPTNPSAFLPLASTSRRGLKRRKNSGQVDLESSRKGQGVAAGVLPGHIGSDDFRNNMMIGPGAGVNPEDIRPQVGHLAQTTLILLN
jgi:hypothetical protein